MENIIGLASQYRYNALEHVDPQDIIHAKIYMQTEDSIFIYKKLDSNRPLYWNAKSEHNIQIYWASNSKEDFSKGISETLKYIKDYEMDTEKVYIEFIPEDFLDVMNSLGFYIVSEWTDFWIRDLSAVDIVLKNNISIRTMRDGEASIAGEVTRSCAGCSRGFTGDSDEFVKEWNDTENTRIFVAETSGRIAGVCFVKLYGFESERGAVLWIREMAVRPAFQSKGIGRELLAYAIKWGIEHGAKRSFLSCDTENQNAIRLYESFQYRKSEERGQINMEAVIK